MLAIDIQPVGKSFDPWIRFWQTSKGGNVTWGRIEGASLLRDFRVVQLGQTVVIDRDGYVVYNGGPLYEYDKLKALVEKAI